MARYNNIVLERERQRPAHEYLDSHNSPAVSVIAPAYDRIGVEYRDPNHSAMIRSSHKHGGSRHSGTVIEEPLVEHEHHHLHHHIDHGDARELSIALNRGSQRPGIEREYSYDDLDIHERLYRNGGAAVSVHHSHDREPQNHRRRHRHRSRRGSRTRISRSEVDLTRISGESEHEDDVTVVDVPAGTRRIYVNVEPQREREREREVDWRREQGIRRSRGLGNELWTEITKDLVTREAIEDLGFPFEETDFFYYIFEYLDRHQIAELRELTDEIRRERVRDLEYNSIAGSQRGHSPKFHHYDREFDDSRTEVIIDTSGHSRRDRPKRRYRY